MWFAAINVTLTILACIAGFIEYKRRKLSRTFQHIPGPKEYPLVGSLLTLKSNRLTDYQDKFDQICVAPVSKLIFGGQLILVVSEPAALQQILSSQAFLSKPFMSDFLGLKFGLSSARYHIWKPIRKAANFSFSHRASLNLIPLFNRHSSNYRSELNNKLIEGKEFDMYDICVKVTIAQLLESTTRQQSLGTKFNRNIIEDWACAISKRAVNPIYYPYKVFKNSHLYQPYKAGHKHLSEIWSPVVSQANKWSTKITEDLQGRVLIDSLMKLADEGGKFNTKLIHDNLTSVLSGFETISLTISYTILMLAMHPEVDKKLEIELIENYKLNEPIDYDLIKRLKYLDMVVKETMRLFPASPISPRESVSPLQVDGIGLVPTGTIVVIPFHKLHRWKYIWGVTADDFDPERFQLEEVEKRHAYSYLPFSSGSRNCIGYNYAMISVKIALIKILSEFKFTTNLKMNELVLKMVGTLKLQNKHLVKVHRRRKLPRTENYAG